MSVLYLVLPLALVIVAVAVAAYVWATRSGQMDDLDTPAIRMLHDDEPPAGARTPRRDEPPG
jgi:cbb3-type cytochrome oxidase maturation protein